ncbi:MAG: biopolymer transporter ExbD [Steroidobacteraceae bacterium]
MKLGSTRREDPELNMTSLIDVVLLLVIFFMLATTFVKEGRLRVELPEATAAPAEAPLDPLVITITAQGAYRVNERTLVNNSRDTLRATLRKVAGGDTDRAVTIRADARATHQSVVTAMDVAARLGFTQVNIATISQQTED